MRYNYDSIDYWENLISENKTIRGHMFMKSLPTQSSLYIHTLVFCKNNGLNNIWGYFPSEKALLGYIQYSFLQEAFYKWIYGKDRIVVNIPNVSVEKIINDGELNNNITAKEAENMRKQLEILKECWSLPKDELIRKLMKFARDFNRTWYGDHKEFLYLKIFKTTEELCEFVINSSYMTATEAEFQERIGVSISEWKEVCENAINDNEKSEKFRKILLKHLTEII